MTFREGLYHARSHIVFVLALIVTFAIVIGLEQWDPDFGLAEVTSSKNMPTPQASPLTPTELEWAKTAWVYFEKNKIAKTGLTNGVSKRDFVSVEDMGASLMALYSAQKLGIVSSIQFDQQVTRLLQTIAALPLLDQALPNSYYHTQTLEMVDEKGMVVPNGVGWSSVRLAQLVVSLQVLVWHHPEYAEQVQNILKRWQLNRLVADGVLYGAYRDVNNDLQHVPEGRIGFQEFASRALSLVGLEPFLSRQYRFYLQWENVLGVKVPIDQRGILTLQDYTTSTSDPYVLHGLIFGWDIISQELAYRVYRAQEVRYEKTLQKTAVGMSYIERDAMPVIYAVEADGQEWVCVVPDGTVLETKKTIDVAIAFGWWALYRTPYTKDLIEHIIIAHDQQAGWFAGLYETDNNTNEALTCRTNAIILQALCYKAHGPLFSFR